MHISSRLRLALVPVLLAVLAIVTLRPVLTRAQAGARERTLFVSAVDEKGAPVEGLAPDAFVVREDGVRREILRVSRAIEPIDIALLIDNSASAGDLIPRVREGIRAFITALGTQDANIAIVGLAARPTIIVDYTTNKGQLETGIGRLFAQPNDGMTLLDAFIEISQGLARRETTRAVLVPVITNGVEYSNRDYRTVLEAIAKGGAAVHAITVGIFDVALQTPLRDRNFVLDMGPSQSGGQRVTVLTTNAIEGAMQKLARELASQYKVVYGRPESLIPPEKTEVSASRAGITMRGTPARGQKTGA